MSSNKMEFIRNRIVEQIAENMKSYGYSGTIGRVIAIIYYKNKPMNLDELAMETGMSKARMSQVLREMVDLNIAEKVFVKGSRKDMYIVEKDYYQTFISLFTSNWQSVVNRNRKIDTNIIHDLQAILQDPEANAEDKQEAELYIKDTEESLKFFDWVDRLVDHLESHDIFQHVPKSKE